MKTPDSKFVKSALKAYGVDVKRSIVYKKQLIVTVAISDADVALELLNDMGLLQSWDPNAPAQAIKVNRVGLLGVAEFTGLIHA